MFNITKFPKMSSENNVIGKTYFQQNLKDFGNNISKAGKYSIVFIRKSMLKKIKSIFLQIQRVPTLLVHIE